MRYVYVYFSFPFFMLLIYIICIFLLIYAPLVYCSYRTRLFFSLFRRQKDVWRDFILRFWFTRKSIAQTALGVPMYTQYIYIYIYHNFYYTSPCIRKELRTAWCYWLYVSQVIYTYISPYIHAYTYIQYRCIIRIFFSLSVDLMRNV